MEDPSSPGGALKLPTNTVYIFNMSEDVWPFIKAFSDEEAKHKEIEENADLGDRDLFSFCGEDNMIFILPRPVREQFLNYYTTLFGKKNFRILVPNHHSGVICSDIENDPQLLQELIKAANGQKRLTLKSYTTSQPFLDLVRLLREKGLTIFTPDAPDEEDAWTVNFYGSKSGIRQLSQQSRATEPDLIMPDGIVVSGIIDASRIAANKYIREHGVVIKTNKGHSGAGVLLLREGDLPTEYTACQKKVLSLLRKDEYWKLFPIIIESLISVNQSIGGGCPNVEYRILKNGHVEFLFSGGMRVTKDGVFKGMEINNEVISDQFVARMVDTGFYIAEQYRSNGYVGYFDVDFVAAKNGQLYVTESNVRRTGGTHVHAVAETLFGKDFMYLTYILSNNNYDLPGDTIYSFNQIQQMLQPILFQKKTREGIVLISESLLSYKRLAYIIFARNKKRAYEIESSMEMLLRS
jgi:hypothetical protein